MVPPQTLMVGGPFAWCRNPMQFGLGLYIFGICLLDGGWRAAVLAWVVAMVVGWAYHHGVEEKELVLRFGADYEAYRARTPFLWPRRPRPQASTAATAPASPAPPPS
jgi:protein-S-isoprenylcysteine O-methyltransferase Ste14